MKTLDVVQGSPEWLAARCAKHRASRTDDLLAKLRSGSYGQSRENYKTEVVLETLTGRIEPSFTTPAMQRGIDLEPAARAAFEVLYGEIETVGLVIHPENDRFVASPDGLVKGEKTLLEIKCPNSATHVEYILKNAIPLKYFHQIQAQLAVTGYNACFFVSYDDRVPPELQLYIKKVKRCEVAIKNIMDELEIFLKDVDDTVAQLREKIKQGRTIN